MRRYILPIVATCVVLAQRPVVAQRTVSGQRLTSTADPALEITVAPPLRYLGTQRFILYDVADAEQHFFVESAGGVVTRLVWIQFESMRAGSPGRYGYESSPVIQRWNRDLHADAYATITPAADAEPRADSDGARMRSFLRDKGLTFPRDVLMQRLVWVPTADRRSEVMVIYAEALGEPGVTSAELRPGGARREALWPAIAASLLERASGALTMTSR